MSRGLLVGQAGGATAVINRSLVGVLRAARESGAYDRMWGMRRGAEGALAGELLDLTGIGDGDLEAVARTPGAALGSSRRRIGDDDAERILDLCRARSIDSLFYIGGNDSADTGHRLAQHAKHRGQTLHTIAIPKTIDNDLPETDHCPGYGSIARFVATATQDSAQDTQSMPTMYPVKIIEVMGRDAGWVVAASALGKRAPEDAPHVLYTPERPVTRSGLLADVARVHGELGWVVVVAAETVRDDRGRPFADPGGNAELDPFGHPLIRGTAEAMARAVQEELGLRARYDKPGSLQRMSASLVSPVDAAEADMVGRHAVRLALEGQNDVMVTLTRRPGENYGCDCGQVALERVANRQRLLPAEYLLPDASGVTDAFVRYARPLLGPNALPTYARLPAT